MKRLGRGLADIISSPAPSDGPSSFVMLRTEQIRPGRFQPRGVIKDGGLEELKASIKRSGVIEPVIVRPLAHGTYELVAGERRLKASQAIGIQEVPAIIKTLGDQEALEFSLIENIQREDLNPLEEAKGYARLLDEFGYTQEDIATAVGKDRATIANLLRVLALPDEVQRELAAGKISLGHAKVLLSLADRLRQAELCQAAIAQGWSVRQLEVSTTTLAPRRRRRTRVGDPQLKALEDQLRQRLGTKVTLASRKKGGRIVVEYFSPEDLTRILQAIGVSA